jgi:hypothetical protein
MRTLLPLALLVPLCACSEAQICRINAAHDVRVLDRLIREQQQTVDQGYRLIEIDSPFLGMCFSEAAPAVDRDRHRGHHHRPYPRHFPFCDDGPRYIRQSVNITAERAKLASLIEQRQRAEAPMQAALAACPPE